ncbi:MAG TPA: dihydroorotate dehydrogenase-like protein [bacterium]|nr:dihydroorotate dehydrogenase-like protein [bacterium]
MNMQTQYLGLTLRNPVIVGACRYTADMKSIKQIEEAGAGALVIKSLFEEQVRLESLKLNQDLHKYDDLHAEMVTLFPELKHAGPDEHLMWTRKAKEAVSVPVIASLNCVNREVWLEYAKQLAETGVDALELNFYHMPADFGQSGKEIEAEQSRLLKEIKRSVDIPVSVKLTPFYTNMLDFINELDETGVQGYVLFNRLFQPFIDVEKEEHVFPLYLSPSDASRLPLRYVGLLHGFTPADLCAATGIYTGEDVARMILAGADCVQVVSALYKNGIQAVQTIIGQFEAWMKKRGYTSIEEFKGKMSRKNIPDPWVYRRAQYVQMLMKGNPMEM